MDLPSHLHVFLTQSFFFHSVGGIPQLVRNPNFKIKLILLVFIARSSQKTVVLEEYPPFPTGLSVTFHVHHWTTVFESHGHRRQIFCVWKMSRRSVPFKVYLNHWKSQCFRYIPHLRILPQKWYSDGYWLFCLYNCDYEFWCKDQARSLLKFSSRLTLRRVTLERAAAVSRLGMSFLDDGYGYIIYPGRVIYDVVVHVVVAYWSPKLRFFFWMKTFNRGFLCSQRKYY